MFDILKNKKIILGLSGGADSVFLLHKLHENSQELGLQIVAAHLNHGWRDSAINDEFFCKKLCADLGIKLIVANARDLDFIPKDSGSKEDQGRQLRRYFFNKLAESENADYVVLAHHADDQIENFFIRLIRGTSLSGLAGIKEVEGIYYKPLLNISKSEILNYLNYNNIKYMEDPTNSSDDFLRNRIRKNVIPEIKKVDDRFNINFLKTVKKLQDTEAFVQKIIAQECGSICSEIGLNLKEFFLKDEYLQNNIIIYWLIQNKVNFTLTDSFIKEVLKFLSNTNGGEHVFNGWKIIKKQSFAKIIKL